MTCACHPQFGCGPVSGSAVGHEIKLQLYLTVAGAGEVTAIHFSVRKADDSAKMREQTSESWGAMVHGRLIYVHMNITVNLIMIIRIIFFGMLPRLRRIPTTQR